MNLTVESRDNARILTMTAGKANAMNPTFFENLIERLEELEKDPAPLILTAGGKIFCAGLDLVILGGMQRPELEEFFKLMDRALLALLNYPAPTVAAMGGHAIAGGAVLALACDARVLAREPIKFGLSEVAVGVSFPGVPFAIVRDKLPAGAVREVLQFATLFDPEGALANGLADELVDADRLLERALERALRINADSLEAYAIVKAQVNRTIMEEIARNQAEDDRRFLDNWFSPACQRRMAAAIAGFKKG